MDGLMVSLVLLLTVILGYELFKAASLLLAGRGKIDCPMVIVQVGAKETEVEGKIRRLLRLLRWDGFSPKVVIVDCGANKETLAVLQKLANQQKAVELTEQFAIVKNSTFVGT